MTASWPLISWTKGGPFTTTSTHYLGEADASHTATSSPRSIDSAWWSRSSSTCSGQNSHRFEGHAQSHFLLLLFYSAHRGGKTNDTRASAGSPAAGAQQHSIDRGERAYISAFLHLFLRVWTGRSNNNNNGAEGRRGSETRR